MSTNIYFIKNTTTNNFKIGKANCPGNRLKQLQTGNEAKLELYKSICAKPKLETLLHSYFKKYRMNGEWFNITDDDVDKVIYLVNCEVAFSTLSMHELRLLARISDIKANLKKKDIISALEAISNNKKSSNEKKEISSMYDESCIIL